MEFRDSLSLSLSLSLVIHLYNPSPKTDLLDDIQCPYKADVSKSLLVD